MFLSVSANAIDGWRAAKFGAQQAISAIAGDLADPDHDHIPNMLEYALNGDPNTPSSSPLPVAGRTTVNGSDYLTLTFTRPLAAVDADYTVEVSGDLAIWNAGSHYSASGNTSSNVYTTEVSRTSANGLETIVVRDNTPFSAALPRFMHLRVAVP